MTKAEIARRIHEETGLSKKEAAQLVQFMLDEIRSALIRGENVKISGFGQFVVQQRAARKGRNPKTGEEIEIAPRKVVVFRASPILKRRIEEADR